MSFFSPFKSCFFSFAIEAKTTATVAYVAHLAWGMQAVERTQKCLLKTKKAELRWLQIRVSIFEKFIEFIEKYFYRIFRKKRLWFFDKFDKKFSFIRVTFCKHLGYRFWRQSVFPNASADREIAVEIGRKSRLWISGLRSRRRTYHTILKLADHALFKMVRYVLLHSGTGSSKQPDIIFFEFFFHPKY
jgi:hypothetical protein